LLQPRDFVHHVAFQDRRVVPGVGIFEGGGHDVLGHAVHPVRPLATAEWVPCGEEFVAASTQQQRLGGQRLGEQRLGPRVAVLVPNVGAPVAAPEVLLTSRVLDDPVERDVLADNDLSHVDSPFDGGVVYH
jgi:hypothetical protein